MLQFIKESKMSSNLFKFQFSGSTITNIQRFDDGVWETKSPDANEVWTYNPATNTVKEVETERGITKTHTYTDTDGDNVYFKSSGSSSSSSSGNSSSPKLFDFVITGNTVTGIKENKNGTWENKDLDAGRKTWTYDAVNQTVTKTENENGYIELTTYARNDAGFFVRVAETYQVGALVSTNIDSNLVSDDIIYGDDSGNKIKGGSGNDYIESYGGNDNISGGKGNDYLFAGAGKDKVDGGSGNDFIFAGDGAGNDSYNGGSGNDTVIYSSATQSVTVNLNKGRASGAEIDKDKLKDIENVVGGSGDDFITGNNKSNYLIGNDGNDLINGGKGKDTLVGGDGNDTLTGGVGADTFKWSLSDAGTAGSPNTDVITDFNTSKKDALDLRDLLVGESSNDISSLLNYLDVSTDGANTHIRVSSSGGFTGGNYSAAAEDQHITLNSNLLGSLSEADFLQSLINNKNLIID
jgi:Ca2+-binding RTX toxin-like protein